MGRPSKEQIALREQLKKDQELLELRKQAAELLLKKGLALLERGKTTEGRQCLRQAEEMFLTLGVTKKPVPEEQKEEEEKKKQAEIERRIEALFDPRPPEEERGLFDHDVVLSDETLGMQEVEEKEFEKEEKPVEKDWGERKGRLRIRRRK